MAGQSRRGFLTLAGATLGSVAAGAGGGVALLRTLMPQSTASAARESDNATCPPAEPAPHAAPAASAPRPQRGASVPAAVSGHDAQALLLTCMDFRLLDHVGDYMASQQLSHQYDHVILAGASLGVVTDRFPEWGAVFWKHLELSKQLHKIKQVMVIDHRDCGAYSMILGPDAVASPAAETRAHVRYLARLREQIWDGHPELDVDLVLMGLDGKIERIG